MQLSQPTSLASVPLHIRSWEDTYHKDTSSENEFNNLKETSKNQTKKLEKLDSLAFLSYMLKSGVSQETTQNTVYSRFSEFSNEELDNQLKILETQCRQLKEQKHSCQEALAFTLTRISDGRLETQNILNDELPKVLKSLEERKESRNAAEAESLRLEKLTEEETQKLNELREEEKQLHDELDRILEDYDMLTQKHKMLSKNVKTSVSNQGGIAKLLSFIGLSNESSSYQANSLIIEGSTLNQDYEQKLQKMEDYAKLKAAIMQQLNMQGIEVALLPSLQEDTLVVQIKLFEGIRHKLNFIVKFDSDGVPFVKNIQVFTEESLTDPLNLPKLNKLLKSEPKEKRQFPKYLPDMIDHVVNEIRRNDAFNNLE